MDGIPSSELLLLGRNPVPCYAIVARRIDAFHTTISQPCHSYSVSLRLLNPLSLRHFSDQHYFQIPRIWDPDWSRSASTKILHGFGLYKQRRLPIQLVQVDDDDDDDDDLPSPMNSISCHWNSCEVTLKSWCQGRIYSLASNLRTPR